MSLLDYFGKDASSLKNKKLFLLDMDGTIYQENNVFDGTIPFLNAIEEQNGKYVFVTNNSSKGVEDYVAKVTNMGIKADKSNFFTSTQATTIFLNDKYKGKKVFCMGTKSMIRELLDAGINVTEETDDDVDLVLMGYDTELTSEKLRKICFLLGRDLPYYATNCDLRCPVSFGYVPDCGSVSIMIYNCTGKKPVFIGKPEPTMINIAMNKFGVSKEDTVVIGDRLYTDIASGNNAGVTSICVLSGEVDLDDINISDIKPTFVFDSVKEIGQLLKS